MKYVLVSPGEVEEFTSIAAARKAGLARLNEDTTDDEVRIYELVEEGSKSVTWTGEKKSAPKAKAKAPAVRRTWSADEDTELLRLVKNGHSQSEIGRALGRAPSSVQARLKLLSQS